MSEHILKVQPPYFDALADGSKTFEVRRNDRGFQRGDTLVLWEYKPDPYGAAPCDRQPLCPDCPAVRFVRRTVTYVYAGDPRFGGIQPGHVVLGLGPFKEGGQ
ncbi:hypothetical protein GCM10022215_29900 [Nocardioides fonticola]|uniref:DUF3850 domain-containing protein n=1 Tax=Nocardioides fonticola TaxID=450363 RepID=A0ABP7XQ87_9ACTN